ncbi:hypothetical protein WOLCODRAFT_164534 [Wolfiporia cocos MD-104 SS10]|uniref:Uncharacterized protein n=1 Tax=Wolfiporia cocos (strain MD-104) TaxID=742152 RepID=A0A2H3JMZ6_WOLCO|nr:hypothetical protein WOLCODRAFT_164534 [Wolfiporia cocos MD-104 SS10]
MGSSSDTLTHLLPLDELIQVIYQGSSRFVVLSNVEELSWTVYVGLSGPEGRWWSGCWKDTNVRSAVGANISASKIETYAGLLEDAFVQGELYIGNWSTQKGAKINFTLGANLDNPAKIPLVEMPSEEVASLATKVFTNIALQSRLRKNRLHPPPFATSAGASNARSQPSAGGLILQRPPARLDTLRTLPTDQRTETNSSSRAADTTRSAAELRAQDEIKTLKAELARVRSEQTQAGSSARGQGKRHTDAANDTDTRPSKAARSAVVLQDTSRLHSIASTYSITTPITAGY